LVSSGGGGGSSNTDNKYVRNHSVIACQNFCGQIQNKLLHTVAPLKVPGVSGTDGREHSL